MTTRKPSKNALSEIIAQAGSWAVSPPSLSPSSETASSTDAMGATSGLLRVGAYCRYSSHAQDDGFSLPAQHDAIAREARAQGTWALRWYDEPATSAYTEDLSRRPSSCRCCKMPPTASWMWSSSIGWTASRAR